MALSGYRWDECVLSCAYFPPVEYFVAIASSRRVTIEACEIYQKQSYRNRCNILTPTGVMTLSLPIKRGGEEHSHHIKISEAEIDYTDPWIHRHKRAIESAYMSSPFFEYYRNDLFKILDEKIPLLFELDIAILRKLLELCGLRVELSFTEQFVKEYRASGDPSKIVDLREVIHPKSRGESLLKQTQKEKPYWQVFSPRQGFTPNLSLIDLLFNEGPDTLSYLQ